jgi:predicted nucleic-acid-binding protein
MNVIADTNILVRMAMKDDEQQTEAAVKLFMEAKTFTVSTTVMCEYVWVLSRVYKQSNLKVAESIRNLIQIESVVVKDEEIEAGLMMLEQGGDFADGVHAFTGAAIAPKSAVFASFDKKAVRLLAGRGFSAFVPE